MIIHEDLTTFEKKRPAIVTSGTFDGVHKGHQKILLRLRQMASMKEGEVIVLTYWPHPRMILFPEEKLSLINTFDEKAELLREYGVDHLVKIPFTREFAAIGSQEFITRYLVNGLKTDVLVIGYNHRFGKNREGGFEYLKENESRFGFQVEEIPRQEVDEVGVSSTRIREAILEGDVKRARLFMGHDFSLTGTVVHGDKIGKQLGFPTANISVNSPHKILPSDGVYAVMVKFGSETRKGMLYIGNRPTINGTQKNIEVNLFGFEGDLYGKQLQVSFIAQVRGDMKFDSLEALALKLREDRDISLSMLSDHEPGT